MFVSIKHFRCFNLTDIFICFNSTDLFPKNSHTSRTLPPSVLIKVKMLRKIHKMMTQLNCIFVLFLKKFFKGSTSLKYLN